MCRSHLMNQICTKTQVRVSWPASPSGQRRPNRSVERTRAAAATSSRFLGAAPVLSESISRRAIAATSSIARSNAASLAFDGALNPLSFRTNCSDAARISSSVAGGSKLNSVLMFLHISDARLKGSRYDGARPKPRPRLARESSIFYPVRLIGFGAEAASAIGFVILIVALEPFDLAVAFEGEHVGRDAIEEPAVVADDDGAARKVEERLLERAQRVHVEIVGRLVEQQQVAALLEQFGEMDAVALAARQRADAALLRRTLEIEPGDVGARRDFSFSQLDLVVAAGDLLPHGLVAVERIAALIDIPDLHRLADLQST